MATGRATGTMSLGQIASSSAPDSVGGGATSTYPAEVLADSPLLYLRLGELSGTIAVDSSGNGRDGTYYGSPTLGLSSLVEADTDSCVYFNNVTEDYVSLSVAPWMDVSSVTVTCIARVAPSGLQILVGRYHDPDSDRSWFLCIHNGEFKFYAQNTSGGGTWVDSGVTAEQGKTYFIAGYSSAAGAGIRVYDSAGLIDWAVGTGQDVNPSSRPFTVARSDDGNTYQSEAYIDDVVFYGSVLSTARIDALASLAIGPKPKWVNFTSGISSRNGTTDHTFTFAATDAGSLVVAVLAATYASPMSFSHGWTQRFDVVDSSTLTVLTRRVNAGETTLQVTYGDSDRAVDYAIYEFPSGSRWHSSAVNINGPPTLNGLPGATSAVVVLATSIARYRIDDVPTFATWTFFPFIEDCDLMSDIPGGNGIFLTTGHCDMFTGTSASPNRSIWNGGAPSQDAVFAIIVP